MSSIVCLSHREDVDGILSAALIKAVSKTKRTQVILADYANILSKLQKIASTASNSAEPIQTNTDSPVYSSSSTNSKSLSISSSRVALSGRYLISDKNNKEPSLSTTENATAKYDNNYNNNSSSSGTKSTGKPKRLFICDLGLSRKTEDKFVGLVKEIISKGIKVTYFDHHDIDDELRKKLKKTGVTLIHSVEECTSVQIYSKYKNKLDSHAAFFAASAALTDYMESRPLASSIVSRYDRQFLMLEATALSYMISSNQHNEEFLVNTVNTLSEMKYPHEIEGGFAIAERYVKKVADGVRIVHEVASNLGGSGGGHEKACGAVIPKDKLEEFINAIDKQVGK